VTISHPDVDGEVGWRVAREANGSADQAPRASQQAREPPLLLRLLLLLGLLRFL
jgi:hypothetical protein